MMIQNKNKLPAKKNIAILTTCINDWGGSEELWALSIPYLQKANFSITILKQDINLNHKRISDLKKTNVSFMDLNKNYSRKVRIIINAFYQCFYPYQNIHYKSFEKFIKYNKPSLVIIAQGINFDALYYGYLCLKHKINYVIISQKVVEFYWPQNDERDYMISTFENAKKCFFVSEHNKNLTEEQFGFRFQNADVVFNPIKLNITPIEYPSTEFGYKLALIGRLLIIDKGQDILFRILSKEKWKKRNLTVSLIGSGPDYDGLRSLANLLKLNNIEFLGFQDNIEQIWQNHHALILPSRSEGLPLVVIEAMAAGRTIIAAKAGGTVEIVQEGITGFMGNADETSFDITLEKAWEERLRWKNMGIEASTAIRNKIPNKPEKEFADKILALIHE